MTFNRFRPVTHFIAPHSWQNDPCGAVYIPEIEEYIFCYQWNPGTTAGGNCAWGMARSKDMVTWKDCTPAIRNGSVYDTLGVFSGSIVSRLIEGRRVLFLFYTSVSAVPIHWSKPYLAGCESQSVAVSTDFGVSWNRYQNNPLLVTPPNAQETTGWRDPFVSRWERLSHLLGVDSKTNYMMIATGKRGQGSQLHLYKSDNLLDWNSLSCILEVKEDSRVSSTSRFCFGKNFECASFFSIKQKDYIILGVEEGTTSKRHDGHYNLWLCGNLTMQNGSPEFAISSHGILDHGVAYAPHIFRDSKERITQLAWANETAELQPVMSQGWAGCLTHPRELYEIIVPISECRSSDLWEVNSRSGTMTTLGIRPASQVSQLRSRVASSPLSQFSNIQSTNYEVDATFVHLSGNENFTFRIRESPDSSEVTNLFFDLENDLITVDRAQSSIEKLGISTSDSGIFKLLPNEDLHIHFFVDNSILEIYVNDRFALTSRIYPSLEASVGASFDFGGFDEKNIRFEFWEGLENAWPERKMDGSFALEAAPSLAPDVINVEALDPKLPVVVCTQSLEV